METILFVPAVCSAYIMVSRVRFTPGRDVVGPILHGELEP